MDFIFALSLVHTSDGSGDGDRSTKFHTNPVKRRQNIREWKGLFSSVLSPFYRVCMEFCVSISVSTNSISASVSIAGVNHTLGCCRNCFNFQNLPTPQPPPPPPHTHTYTPMKSSQMVCPLCQCRTVPFMNQSVLFVPGCH